MERERLGRLLSLALVPLGLLMLLFALFEGETVTAAIAVVAAGSGVALYSKAGTLFDSELDPGLQTDQSFVVVLTQLVLTVITFGLLVFLVGDVRAVTSLFRTGIESPAAATVGVAVGIVLGGGVALLTDRSPAFAEWSTSFPVSLVGHSLTAGAFLVLLLVQPPASMLYAAAYTLSRLAVVVGVYLRS